MKKKLRIFLIDDEQCFREAMRSFLEIDYLVVGDAQSRNDAFKKIKNLNPDVVIIVHDLPPDINSLELARDITRYFSGIGVILCSLFSLDQLRLTEEKLREYGIVAFVEKGEFGEKIDGLLENLLKSSVKIT